MSDDSNEHNQTSILRRPMPLWLATTIVGAFLGGAGTYQVMRAVGYDLPDLTNTGDTGERFAEMRAKMADAMRQNMERQDMMMSRMMSMMSGSSASEQRKLTSLVGKLDLLSKGLRIELQPDQVERLAATLSKLDQAEKMSSDEAHGHFDAIQKFLTEEQKAALTTIELPGGGPSGIRGMGGSGDAPPGSGAPRPDGAVLPIAMMGSGMMSPPSNDNPFQQEINQTRLHDFLDRLCHSSVESPDVTEEFEVTGTQETTCATKSPQP